MAERKGSEEERSDLTGAAMPVHKTGLPWLAPRLPGWLTVEVALYLGILLLAAALRLVNLGEPVLSAEEGRRALAGYHALRGEPAELQHGPTLVYGGGLLFFLLGANDAVARLLPALAGLWLVVWPALMRGRLGRGGALFTSLLLALSPALVYASRSVAGETLVLGLCALASFGWLRYLEGRGRANLALAGVAAGLALAGGPAGYTLLVPLALFLVGWRVVGGKWWAGLRVPTSAWRVALTSAAAALVVAVTGLWTSPAGVQEGLIDAGTQWANGPGVPWYFYLIASMLYESASLLMALLALLLGGPRLGLAAGALAFAWLAGILFSLVGVGRPEALALLAAPLALAGGQGLWQLWQRLQERMSAAEGALFLAITVPVVGLWGTVAGYWSLSGGLIGPGFLLAGPDLFGQSATLWSAVNLALLLTPLSLLLLAAAFWAHWRGWDSALHGLGLLAALVLLLGAVHASTGVAFAARPNPAEPLAALVPSPDLRSLITEIEDHTAVMATPRRRDLAVAVAEPLRQPLAWYLRDYPRATYGDLSGQPVVVVSTPQIQPPAGAYRYQRYVWQRGRAPLPATAGQLWRWLVYRAPAVEVPRQEALLYVVAQTIN